MLMQLRPYQDRAVSSIRDELGRHKSVCLALQVGGGKTVIACEVIRRVIAANRRALFIVHRIELVEQARDRLAAFGIKAGIIKAGFPAVGSLPVQVACVPTLARRAYPKADLVIFDETHHAVSESWLSILRHYRKAGSWILGITATPLRLDGKPLGAAFETIIEPVTTSELIEGGFLLDPVVFAPPSIDRKGLPTRGGDFAIPELAVRMEKLTGSITDYWNQHCRGRRTLAFAVNIAHSRLIEDALRAQGARVAHVDGGTDRRARSEANRMLRSGELDVVTQCQIWTEGLDIPELECLIVARPTKSLSLHRQMIGRVMRPAPGKARAVVLDHAGNHHVHGPITAPVEWSLAARQKRPTDDVSEPVRTCPKCFAVLPPATVKCPECGTVVGAREQAEPPGVENPGVLIEFKAAARGTKAEERDWYVATVREASGSNRSLGWAKHRFKEHFGAWPRLKDVEVEHYVCPGCVWERKQLGPREVMRCKNCFDIRASGAVPATEKWTADAP